MLALFAKAGSIYPYFIEIADDDAMEINDTTFYTRARSVIFPVNRYVIPDSSEIRKELPRELARMDSLGYVFRGAAIRGGASPEGPLKGNKRLSRQRTQAVYDILKATGRSMIDETRRYEVPEDYKCLVYMMRQASDPDADKVQQIVDRYYDTNLPKLKKELKRVDGGRLWKRLLKEYYPELRASRVIFFIGPPPVAEPPVFAPSAPADATAVTSALLPEPSSMAEFTFAEASLAEVTLRRPRRELLAVKTNVLYDFAYMPGYDRFCPIPNVAIEYYPRNGHFTFGAAFDCPWWRHYDEHKFFQVRQYQLESRYYLRSGDLATNHPGMGAAFRGLYFNGYINTGLYSICFDANRGWEGEAIGAGLGIGYALPISRDGHWKLDFGIQAGYLWTKFDPYQWECPVDPNEHDHKYYYKTSLGPSLFQRRQHFMNWLGPTRIGISISYDLLYRRWGKSGASFRNSETLY